MHAKVTFPLFLIGGSFLVPGGLVVLIKLRNLVPLQFIGIVGLVVSNCALGFPLLAELGGQIHHKSGVLLSKWKALQDSTLDYNSKWRQRFVRSTARIKIRYGSVNYFEAKSPLDMVGVWSNITMSLILLI